MSELPERTRLQIDGVEAMRLTGRLNMDALLDPALGPDRLVVAGPFEREVATKICAFIDSLPDDDIEWRAHHLSEIRNLIEEAFVR